MSTMIRFPLRTLLVLAALSPLAGCDDPTTTVSRCVPEGACEELAERSSPAAVFSAVGGDPEQGRALYREHCAECHGDEGRGAGHDDRGDFTSPAWQAGRTDNQIRLTILNGRGMMMPAFSLGEGELKDLISYLRTMREASASPGSQYE